MPYRLISPTIYKCEYCSGDFLVTNYFAKYCSNKCKSRVTELRRDKEKRKIHTISCMLCGNTFMAKSKHTRFCSNSCKAKYTWMDVDSNMSKLKDYRGENSPLWKGGPVSTKMRRTYGIDLAEYNRVLQEQGGLCAICKGDKGTKRLSIDHDHTTGRVRGLLCHYCNLGIGLFGDDITALKAAIQYLEEK